MTERYVPMTPAERDEENLIHRATQARIAVVKIQRNVAAGESVDSSVLGVAVQVQNEAMRGLPIDRHKLVTERVDMYIARQDAKRQ